MRNITQALCVLAVLACAALPVAQAASSPQIETHADMHYWVHPGRHPLALQGTDGRTPEAIACAISGLQMSEYDAEQFKKATATPFDAQAAEKEGRVMQLVDGTTFARMTYAACKTVDNIMVKWGAHSTSDRRAEVVTIVEKDGTIKKYVRPFICNNWSLLAVIRPRHSPCFILHLDYRSNSHVMQEGNLQTAGALVANGLWKGSADAAYLNDDAFFAFVVMHVDFADQAEFDQFQEDVCTNVSDETGVHHEIEWNCDVCLRKGHWPGQGTIDALAAARNVRLPYEKPSGGFRFPCANGVCDFSMPLWFARRLATRATPLIPCVEVPRYRINLDGHDYRDYRDSDNFDVVLDPEIAASLVRGAQREGNVELNRVLTGATSYTEPGTY